MDGPDLPCFDPVDFSALQLLNCLDELSLKHWLESSMQLSTRQSDGGTPEMWARLGEFLSQRCLLSIGGSQGMNC